MRYFKNQGANTATNLGFPAAPTISATLSSVDDSVGSWLRHTTGTSNGNASGLISTTFTIVQPRWLPEFYANVRFEDNGNGNCHGVAGFVSANTDASDLNNDHPLIAVACFAWFMTLTGGLGKNVFNLVTGDGTGSFTNTAIAPNGQDDSGRAVDMRIVFASSSQVDFYLDGALVGSHTTNLPVSNQGLGMAIRITKDGSADAQARTIDWRRMEVRHV
jgi:hypothetical protein